MIVCTLCANFVVPLLTQGGFRRRGRCGGSCGGSRHTSQRNSGTDEGARFEVGCGTACRCERLRGAHRAHRRERCGAGASSSSRAVRWSSASGPTCSRPANVETSPGRLAIATASALIVWPRCSEGAGQSGMRRLEATGFFARSRRAEGALGSSGGNRCCRGCRTVPHRGRRGALRGRSMASLGNQADADEAMGVRYLLGEHHAALRTLETRDAEELARWRRRSPTFRAWPGCGSRLRGRGRASLNWRQRRSGSKSADPEHEGAGPSLPRPRSRAARGGLPAADGPWNRVGSVIAHGDHSNRQS